MVTPRTVQGMRPVHRRPPALLLRQFLVWFAWFLLSGYVFHDRTAADLGRLTFPAFGVRVGSLTVVVLAGYWFAVLMPAGVRTFLVTGAAVGLSLAVVPLVVQTSVTRYLELRQVWP